MTPTPRAAPATIRLLTPEDAVLYRDIRLEALAAHPEAFASAFAREQEKPLAWFEERLTTSDVFGAFIAEELVGVAGFWRQEGAKTEHKAVLWGDASSTRSRHMPRSASNSSSLPSSARMRPLSGSTRPPGSSSTAASRRR
jgi:hypothetical protein